MTIDNEIPYSADNQMDNAIDKKKADELCCHLYEVGMKILDTLNGKEYENMLPLVFDLAMLSSQTYTVDCFYDLFFIHNLNDENDALKQKIIKYHLEHHKKLMEILDHLNVFLKTTIFSNYCCNDIAYKTQSLCLYYKEYYSSHYIE